MRYFTWSKAMPPSQTEQYSGRYLWAVDKRHHIKYLDVVERRTDCSGAHKYRNYSQIASNCSYLHSSSAIYYRVQKCLLGYSTPIRHSTGFWRKDRQKLRSRLRHHCVGTRPDWQGHSWLPRCIPRQPTSACRADWRGIPLLNYWSDMNAVLVEL